MKKLVFSCLFICLMLPVNLFATDIEILLGQYNIEGAYNCTSGGTSWSDSYNLSSNTSLVNEISSSGATHLALAHSSIENFQLHVAATEWATDGGSAWAMAKGTWTFRPLSNVLDTDFTMWGRINGSYSSQGVKVMLIDLVTGEKLLDQIYTGTMPAWYAPGSYSYTFNVNPAHDYGLFMSAKVTTYDSMGTYIDIGASFMPEPATIIMLGLGAVLLVRKQR